MKENQLSEIPHVANINDIFYQIAALGYDKIIVDRYTMYLICRFYLAQDIPRTTVLSIIKTGKVSEFLGVKLILK